MQTPLILRCMPLRKDDIDWRFYKAIQTEFRTKMREFKLSLEQLIVRAFATMAMSNATTCSWKMKHGQHQDADKTIFEGRNMYRRLCNVASLASRMKAAGNGGRKGKGKGEGKRQASLVPLVASSSIDASTEDFCSVIDSMQHSVEQEFQLAANLMDLKSTSRASEDFRKWRNRPNVHQGAHLGDIIQRYGNSFSCNVLHCEDKHR